MSTTDNIFQLIRERGLSAAQVGKDTGISSALFSQWKKGLQAPSVSKVTALAEYFDVPVDYLLGTDKIKAYDEQDNPIILDRETIEILEQLRENPETRVLFSVAKTVTKEDFEQVVKIIKALKESDKKERN